jgi:putative flippase GtrA
LVRQALRFGAVGLLNTAIGLLAIYALLFFFDTGPVVANAIGYAAGLSVSFYLNRRWTFADRSPARQALPRYLLLAACAYLLNLSVAVLGTHRFGVGPYLVQLLGIGFYTLAMFLGSRWYAFRTPSNSNALL